MKLIHRLSITDDCTGLFNSRHLYTQLSEQISEISDPQVIPIHPHFSLVFLDLDRFKKINDTHGHLVGSRLLGEVGSLLQRTIGPQPVWRSAMAETNSSSCSAGSTNPMRRRW